MIPLRIALGLFSLLALGAAGIGAVMSVKINWEFAQTLGKNAEWGFWLALTFAAVEVARLFMPFIARGLRLADLGSYAKKAGIAFWVFTAISASSAGGFFAMNRADSNAQRSAQISQTKSYQQEMDRLSRRLEINGGVRSVAEVEAEIKGLPKNDPDKRKPALEVEKAAAAQRDKDEARMRELRSSAEWKTTLSTAIATADAQLDFLTSVAPIDKDQAQRWAAVVTIIAAILALELLVGFTPFASVMVLVWALKPQTPVINAKTRKTPEKSGIGEWRELTPVAEYTDEDALKDIKSQLRLVREISTVSQLQNKWGWTYPKTLRKLQNWQSMGVLRLEKRDHNWIICRTDPKLSVVSTKASA